MDLLYFQGFTIDGAKKQLFKVRTSNETKNGDDEEQKLILIKRGLQQIKNMIT
jgi:hypothetical protein